MCHSDSLNNKLSKLFQEHENLLCRKNIPFEYSNGIFTRYKYPVLTSAHTPVFWRYDLNEETNPYMMERIGMNATLNCGAIKWNGKYLLVARVEGADRKSFFAIAESPNGIDNFRFWDYPITMPDDIIPATNIYDMRLTAHEDGWIYGIFCVERFDTSAPVGNLSAAIATAGIDISVGAVVALVCMCLAYLLQNTELAIPVVICLVLLIGIVIGFVQGYLISVFKMQPFIVTLAGMFFCRGMTAVISRDTINIDNPSYVAIASERINMFGTGFISVGALVALIVLIIAIIVLKYTKFGRTIFAIGGNENSASLMGLPVTKTKILAYVISGFCAALGGVVYSWTMLSGYTLHAMGMEMDAIASSVIGGTLLTGGVAFMPGTIFGVLIQGIILTFITFQGTLSAWWTKIVVGALLCIFIIMQALITEHKNKLTSKSSMESNK